MAPTCVALPLSSSRLMTLKPKYGRPRLPPPMHPLPPCHRGKGNVECALSNNASRHSRHFSQLTWSLIRWIHPTGDGSKMEGWWVGQGALETSFVHSIFTLSSKQNNHPSPLMFEICNNFSASKWFSSHCVTQLKLDTGEKLSSSIFCCLSVCQASVSPDQISTFSNIYRGWYQTLPLVP